jgi:predicted enzyme related to lactoylglutathione lyase
MSQRDAATALDVKHFVPTRDLELSCAFYEALGWHRNWRVEGLAELELAGYRLLLQDFYAREWAENSMIYVVVSQVDAWYERARSVVAESRFEGTRARPPSLQPHGDRVAYVWDPVGVLIHLAEPA